MAANPLTPFLDQQGYLVLDGGLATELEARGHDLNNLLWSARLLLDDPAAIREVHDDYLRAGADCIITASYQATSSGFQLRGLSERQAEALIRAAVEIALVARDDFWAEAANRTGRLRPLVAASVGPYGAALADGSEYRGDYGLDDDGLYDFHGPRWRLLAETAADLLACETIPSAAEGRALARLLAETPGRYAWFSFSCRDERHLHDGTLLAEAVAPLVELEQTAAVGVNCTAPHFVPALIAEIRAVTHKPIVAYPNSGEDYDPHGRQWAGRVSAAHFAADSGAWLAAGASLIGGCCRTGPDHIRRIRRRLASATSSARPSGA